MRFAREKANISLKGTSKNLREPLKNKLSVKGDAMPHKPPHEERPHDYAPYTPYDRERWVRVFYIRYSPTTNRRHFAIGYGSTALLLVLALLSLFLGAKGYHLPAAIASFSTALWIIALIFLIRHAENHSWLLTYSHTDQQTIKAGKPLYILRNEQLDDRVYLVMGLFVALIGIGAMIWLGVQNIQCLFS